VSDQADSGGGAGEPHEGDEALGRDRARTYADPPPGTAGLSPDPDAPGRSVDDDEGDAVEPNEPA